MLYNASNVKLIPCKKTKSRGKLNDAKNFERRLMLAILISSTFNMIFGYIDLFASERLTAGKELQLEFTDPWFDSFEILLYLVTSYLTWVYKKLQDLTLPRDDPFSTGTVMVAIIFLVGVQRYIFELVLLNSLDDTKFLTQELWVTFKQTLLSLQFLFLQIHMRHNFSLEYIKR